MKSIGKKSKNDAWARRIHRKFPGRFVLCLCVLALVAQAAYLTAKPRPKFTGNIGEEEDSSQTPSPPAPASSAPRAGSAPAAARSAPVGASSQSAILLPVGERDGILRGAKVALAPSGSQPPANESNAPALGIVEQSGASQSLIRVTRQPAQGRIESDWKVFALAQPPSSRLFSVVILTDSSALAPALSMDGVRGCAGIRKSLRLDLANQNAAELKGINVAGMEVVVEDASAWIKNSGLPASPAGGASSTSAASAPSASSSVSASVPAAAPASIPAAPLSPASDLLIKVNYYAGKLPKDLLADVMAIGPGSDILAKQTDIPAAKISDCVRQMLDQCASDKAQTAFSLAALHNPNPGFSLELDLITYNLVPQSLSKDAPKTRKVDMVVSASGAPSATNGVTVLRRGQRHYYTIKCSKACSLILYNIDSEGEITQLFPNRFMPQNRIEPGKQYAIPDPSDKTQDGQEVYFEVSRDPQKPAGLETIKAIATLEPTALTTANPGAGTQPKTAAQGNFESFDPGKADANWEGAANSLANRIALTRGLSNLPAYPSITKRGLDSGQAKTLQNLRDYLSDLSKWSDAQITFYSAD